MYHFLSVNYALRRVVFLGLALSFLAGCGGGDDYTPFRVSGTVKFDGKPVPAGKIYFIPDSKQGNTGTPGHANIVDGAYDTGADGGKSPQGGKMIVGIEGFDPNAVADDGGEDNGEEVLKALFPYYKTSTELTEEDSTKDFDVPASAADRKDDPEGQSQGQGRP